MPIMTCDKCKKDFKYEDITLLKDGWENNFEIIGFFCKNCLKELTNMNNKQEWKEGFNEQFSYCFNVGVIPVYLKKEKLKQGNSMKKN